MGIVDDEMDGIDGMGRAYRSMPLVRFNAIGEAWGLLLRRWPMWVLTVLIVTFCYSALNGLVFSVFDVRPPRGARPFWIGLSARGPAVSFVLSSLVINPFLGGMYRMACRQMRGQAVGVETLFSVVDVLPQLIIGSILYGLATFLGFCALFFPGFVVSGVLMFTLPLIVDGGLDAIGALTQSWHALKRQWLVATLFHIAASFAASVGLCFCGVGFLFTAPLYCMSIAVLYRDFFRIK
jgi:uncharacterized membrane protein